MKPVLLHPARKAFFRSSEAFFVKAYKSVPPRQKTVPQAHRNKKFGPKRKQFHIIEQKFNHIEPKEHKKKGGIAAVLSFSGKEEILFRQSMYFCGPRFAEVVWLLPFLFGNEHDVV